MGKLAFQHSVHHDQNGVQESVLVVYTHSVCVSTRHQNAKLMIAAVDRNLYYRDLMAMCVCDLQNKDCMIRHCVKLF